MKAQRITDFIKEYGVEVQPNDNVELLMDDHKAILFNDVEYYIPENSSFWDENDEEVYDYLIEHHLS
jgi:hypothetical protein